MKKSTLRNTLRILHSLFSYKFCETSKKTFFTEHLWTIASSFLGLTNDDTQHLELKLTNYQLIYSLNEKLGDCN